MASGRRPTGGPDPGAQPKSCPVTVAMMEWLRQSDLTTAACGTPEELIAEFDLDRALSSKWGPWLACEDALAAFDAAKSVNKWLFMQYQI